MKILHIIQTLSLRAGGLVKAVNELSRYQAKAGLEVSVATTNADFPNGILSVPINQQTLDQGVKTRYFPIQFGPLLVSLPFANWLWRNILYFDVIHVHGLYRFPQTFGAWVSRKAGVPYLITPHGSLDPFLYRQSRHSISIKRAYERFFDFPNLNGASAIHYTTRDEAERTTWLKLRAPQVVVPIGLDWEPYRNLPRRGSFRRLIKLDDLTSLVLFLGRINFKKGLDLLIPAFGRVVKKVPHSHLAIVGPDNEGFAQKVRHWCLDAGLEKKVSFVGHLDEKRVREAYVDADTFILPSYTENFGMTVVEAMACRCPVIISDQVNIWREVKKGACGVVVGLDVSEIANSIIDILSDPGKSRKMGVAGREFVQNNYGWPGVVEEMTNVYQSLIA